MWRVKMIKRTKRGVVACKRSREREQMRIREKLGGER